MTATTTTTTAPVLTTQIADLIDDLTGFHPALDRAAAAIGDLLAADLDTDSSQSLVAALGGLTDGSFATLLGLAVRQIANPDANRALTDLPEDRKQTLRRLGAEYAASIADPYLEGLASSAAGVIEGGIIGRPARPGETPNRKGTPIGPRPTPRPQS